MSADPRDGLSDCGCGTGAPPAGAPVDNAPGLPEVAYRVGTHATFKAAMLARLDTDPNLRGLRTRADDDFAVALLDAWAAVADVLTFYQERIANESFLRTATERLSLAHLARLIGYQPRPGVAAGAFLAFALETAAGAPATVELPAGTRAQSIPPAGETPQPFETGEPFTARAEWNALALRRTAELPLDPGAPHLTLATAAPNLRPGDLLLLVGSPSRAALRRVASVEPDHASGQARVALAPAADSDSTGGTLPEPGVYALRTRAALFGHNAPDWNGLYGPVRDAYAAAHPAPAAIPSANGRDWPVEPFEPTALDLDGPCPQVVPGSWAVVIRPEFTPFAARVTDAADQSLARYTLSGRFTRLRLDRALPPRAGPDPRFPLTMGELRQTVVLAQSEPLTRAADPVDPLGPAFLTLERPDANLTRGQALAVTGAETGTGAPAAEIAIIADVSGPRVTFRRPLARSYVPGTVVVTANVVAATHGETVSETLGGGDAARAYQTFTLRQPPLTHVSAPDPSGAESTLQVRVDGVLWHEVPTLLGRGPRERVYATRTGDDGRTVLQFGDGATGARLPTGRDNVRAVYRKGIGRPGQVAAGAIALPITRPPGLRAVVNPLPASGAQDPETPDEIRANAPLTTLTLDRLVSLQDYEDFTRAFAGIAKALATGAWVGGRRGVVLTVAGLDGAAVEPDGALCANLLAALRANGDPHVPVRVLSYRPAAFRLAARLKIGADYVPDRVRAAVRADLRARFGFAARAFAQPVTDDEIVAAVQAVPGVTAVALTRLARSGGTAGGVPDVLPARAAGRGADGELRSAELLLLAPPPDEPELGEMA